MKIDPWALRAWRACRRLMWATLLLARDLASPWCLATDADARATVDVLSHMALASRAVVEEVLLSSRDWAACVASLQRSSVLRSAVVLESSSGQARVRAELPMSSLDRAVTRSGIGPRFPFEVREGNARLLLVAPREEAAEFVRSLRADGIRVAILSSREHHPHEKLTDRQREIMRAAVAHGYFEVPRRVTLTELARRLHLAKSTLSETLARGEQRIVTSH